MPSPTMAVAFMALLIALSGTAIALPGKNTVDSGDIRRGGVKAADLGRNAVTSPKVKNSTLRGGDVRNESLTGLDIDESTLGQVPSANTANSASTAGSAGSADSVDGSSFARLNYRGETGAAAAPFFSLNGLTLSASCLATNLDVRATTSVSGAMLHWTVAGLGNPIDNDSDGGPNTSEDNFTFYGEADPFNAGEPPALIADNGSTTGGAPDSTQGTLTYVRPDGGIVTATFLMEEEEDALGGTADCFVIGHAQSSG
jgi:hypothetical protein